MYPSLNQNQQRAEQALEIKKTASNVPAQPCEYCGAPAIATIGQSNDYRWCETCQRDLLEFAMQEMSNGELIPVSDQVAFSRSQAEIKLREHVFMREKIKSRMLS